MKTRIYKSLLAGFAVLFLAGISHAQTISPASTNVVMYPDATTNISFVLVGWNGSNVTVSATRPTYLTTATVTPETSVAANRTLSLTADATSGTGQSVSLSATESPTSVHSDTAVYAVTVRARPSITGLTLNNDHDGHFHSDPAQTDAFVVVATNTSVTSISAVSGDTALYTTSVSGNRISITPVSGAAGSALLTVIGHDAVLGGAVTNASTTITVYPIPSFTFGAWSTSAHNGHFHSDPVTAGSIAIDAVSSVNALHPTSGNTGLFTVSSTGTTSVNITPKERMNGTTNLTVVASSALCSLTFTNSIAITIRDPLWIDNLSSNPLNFDEDTTGNITFEVKTCYPSVIPSVTFNPTNIISSGVFSSSGSQTNLLFTPYPDAFGVVTAAVSVAVDSGNIRHSTNIVINVTPVPDPPVISGLPSDIFILSNTPGTNAFANVTITDVDDFPPPLQTERLGVRIFSAGTLVFEPGSPYGYTDFSTASDDIVSVQSSWVHNRSLSLKTGTAGAIGSSRTYDATIIALGVDGLACTSSVPVHVEFVNTPPSFNVALTQSSVMEGQNILPFELSSVNDPDGQDLTLSVCLAPESLQYGYINPSTNFVSSGMLTQSQLSGWLSGNLKFTAYDGVMTNKREQVTFIFELNDGYVSTFVTNSLFEVAKQSRPPNIALGANPPYIFNLTSDSTAPVVPFPQIAVSDPDEGGKQFVRAAITVMPSDYITLSDPVVAMLQSSVDLTDALRAMTFTVNAAGMQTVPINDDVSCRIEIRAVDADGNFSDSRAVTVNIRKLNDAPLITVPQDQPQVFSPSSPVRPFERIGLYNDDTNNVTFTFTMDDTGKGTFGNVTNQEFVVSGNGYTITGAISNILSLVTNVTFTPSTTYPFPVDDPCGTTFTLSARDFFMFVASATLSIQVQEPPRNWLVINPIDDGLPGSLTHALDNFGNNDVITFALPSYPATLRLKAGAQVSAATALTIKGPGADLLTISGDVNGDGAPDRRFMTVGAPVTVEGVTVTDCIGTYGGAFSVVENGRLTLRHVTVRDCIAFECGGAVDVDEYGSLVVEASMFLDNATLEDAQFGGGAVSVFTDQRVYFENTVFARNTQGAENGVGGGAIYVEFPGYDDGFLDVVIIHCTFVDNDDFSLDPDYNATSLLANGGSAVYLHNNIFSDTIDPEARTLNVAAASEIWSFGGNTCDDNAVVFLNQLGWPNKALLDKNTDKTEFDPQLNANFAPMNPLTPRVPAAAHTDTARVSVDAAGRIRSVLSTQAGAIDLGAASFPAITEIQTLSGVQGSPSTDRFIEIYVSRGQADAVDLSGMKLLVNDKVVHVFGAGMLAFTNNGHSVGYPASLMPSSYLLAPGRGVTIVFPAAANGIANFQRQVEQDNITPVVRGSVVTNAADFAALLSDVGRGTVSIVRYDDDAPIVRHTFLAVYNDPATAVGTNLLLIGEQSIATVPQGQGFAFLPHSFDNPLLPESPCATTDGTSFGGDNASPVVRDEFVIATEDDVLDIDVLVNDSDPDNDPVFIRDFDSVSTLGAVVSCDPDTGMLRYDPTQAAALQELPAGREFIDTFTYTILDGHAFGLGGSPSQSGSTPVWTLEFSTKDGVSHGLAVSNTVWIVADNNVSYDFQVSAVPGGSVFRVELSAALTGSVLDALGNGTVYTRNPANSSAPATVTVTLNGLNDNPVGVDDLLVTSLTEREAVRILAKSFNTLTFPDMPTNVVQNVGLLENDWDVDEGGTNETFRIAGVLSGADVHAVAGIQPSTNGAAAIITSAAHGLATGTSVTLVGVVNPARVNGSRSVTVIDADTFSIPVPLESAVTFTRAFWIPVATALAATTPLGASVTLNTRANDRENNIVYNASVSAQLQALSEGEQAEDGFWYAFTDAYEAPAIAYVSLTVNGVNNPPDVTDDPPLDLPDEFGDDWADILTNRLAVLTVLVPPESGVDGRADLIVADKGKNNLVSADLILLSDFYSTDEDTTLLIWPLDLFANDSDIDTNDLASARHYIHSVDAFSLRGAAVRVDDAAGTNIVYNPQKAVELQALGIGETLFDIFTVYISDGHDIVSSRVAVLVRGVNDKPVAYPVYVTNSPVASEVTFLPKVVDVDASDVFPPITVVVPDTSLATNRIPYTVTDQSLFLALDDTFRVFTNVVNASLDVLANDVNFHGTGIKLISVTPSLYGGVITVDAAAAVLRYTPSAGFRGTDVFTYSATNALGLVRKANVRVRVIDHDYNGPLQACDDEYAVARGMGCYLPVTLNDALIPLSADGIIIDPTYNADWPVGLTLTNNMFRYESITNTAITNVVFTYRVTGGGGSVSSARVRIKIIDRATIIQPDWFTAAPGEEIALDLLSNDVLLGDSTAGMRITSVTTNNTVGMVIIDVGGTNVLYTAAANFLGQDIFEYTAVDRYGGVGTAQVVVTVGIPAFHSMESVTVATNTVTLIDVLANETIRPYLPPASLKLIGVMLRAGEVSNGVASVSNNMVRFEAGTDMNALAVWLYTAEMPGAGSPSVITGELSVTTSHTEVLYANRDNLTVRLNAVDVPINVLANDISFRKGHFPLSVQAASVFSERGGSIRQAGDTLYYTPPQGYTGTDTFYYDAYDGIAQARGMVSVYVTAGDLIANDDAFTVGYEWDSSANAAKAYPLPVLGNDAVFPGGSGAVSVSGFGIGANAPQHGGTLEIPGDRGYVLFRPGLEYPTTPYTETFTYEVEDAEGNKKAARVQVRIELRVGKIEIETQDDVFVVEFNSTENVLPVTVNDLVEPKTPLPPSGIHVTASAQFGAIHVAGPNLVYTPPAGFVGIDTATYTLSDGLGGSGTAGVKIYVGSLPTAPDSFSVLRGSTNLFDVLANDAVRPDYTTPYANAINAVFGATNGASISVVGSLVRYVPNATHSGTYPYTETFFYELKDGSDRLTTGLVSVVVYDMAGSLASSVVYVINPDGSGSTINTAREIWNTLHGVSDGTDDPDDDGLTNDAEYVFGGNPSVADSHLGIGYIHIRTYADDSVDIWYVRRANDPALTFRLEGRASLDSGTWIPIDDLDDVSVSAYVADMELETAAHRVAVPGAYRFFRIAVDLE